MKWAFLFSLSLGPQQPKAPPDSWFGRDKWMHFAACAVIQSVGYGVASGSNGHVPSLRIGAAAAGVIGVGREVHDWKVKGQFSGRDLVWDGFGAGTAAIILHAVR